MIYTSYFARLKDLAENVVPISICGRAPDWYTGLQYKKLAPNYEDFARWKGDRDDAGFARRYREHVLSKLDPVDDVILDLSNMLYGFNVGEDAVALICYEKPSDFCHRHLVAEWLNEHGIRCEEYEYERTR